MYHKNRHKFYWHLNYLSSNKYLGLLFQNLLSFNLLFLHRIRKEKNISLLPEISTAVRKWAVKEPDTILLLASSKSKSYLIDPINKKQEKTDALWQSQGNSFKCSNHNY